MRGNLRARRPGRAVLALIAASILVALAGCASASGITASPRITASTGTMGPGGPQAAPTGVAASAGLPLCAGTRQPAQVVLRLTAAHAREILPRAATVTDMARVRALAAALCRLPPIPGGLLHCPAALPGAVLLEFYAQGHAYARLVIHDSGCASVTGLGAPRQWSWSSRPGRLLSEAVGGKGRLIPGTYPSSVPLQ